MSEPAIPKKLQGYAERAARDIMTRAAKQSAGEIEADIANHLEAAIKLGLVAAAEPIPMRLRCPQCNTLHVDEGEYATKPHKTHTCQNCGEHFQPALVPTVGVKFLPGCKSS